MAAAAPARAALQPQEAPMQRALTAALLLLALTAGCSGHTYDEDAHRQFFEAAYPDGDWESYQSTIRQACALDDADLVLLAQASDDRGNLVTLQLGLEYMCPDRLSELEELGLVSDG